MRWKEGLKAFLKGALKFALFILLALVLAELSVRALYAVRSSMMRDRPQPYLFGHTCALLRRMPTDEEPARQRRGLGYRGFALFMTFPPMAMLLLERPVWLVIVYAALGSLFMPFLAATLLVLGNRRERMGDRKSTRLNSSHSSVSRMPSSA